MSVCIGLNVSLKIELDTWGLPARTSRLTQKEKQCSLSVLDVPRPGRYLGRGDSQPGMKLDMATLKEFEEALRLRGMTNALSILEDLKKRDREKRSITPARRVAGKKMTAELARQVLAYHASTGMTQQEIAFKLGVNQGRVNEVIKRGKWLDTAHAGSEFKGRDQAMDRLKQRARARREIVRVRPEPRPAPPSHATAQQRPALPIRGANKPPRIISAQLAFLDL